MPYYTLWEYGEERESQLPLSPIRPYQHNWDWKGDKNANIYVRRRSSISEITAIHIFGYPLGTAALNIPKQLAH